MARSGVRLRAARRRTADLSATDGPARDRPTGTSSGPRHPPTRMALGLNARTVQWVWSVNHEDVGAFTVVRGPAA